MDLNEQLIRAFLEYSKWSNKFELFGYKDSARQARNALRNIQRLAHERYQEIQRKKWQLHGNQNEDSENDNSTT